MKRSNKLSLRTETVRHLTQADLSQVNGGAYSGDCRNSGGGGVVVGTGSVTSEINVKQFDVMFGP